MAIIRRSLPDIYNSKYKFYTYTEELVKNVIEAINNSRVFSSAGCIAERIEKRTGMIIEEKQIEWILGALCRIPFVSLGCRRSINCKWLFACFSLDRSRRSEGTVKMFYSHDLSLYSFYSNDEHIPLLDVDADLEDAETILYKNIESAKKLAEFLDIPYFEEGNHAENLKSAMPYMLRFLNSR